MRGSRPEGAEHGNNGEFRFFVEFRDAAAKLRFPHKHHTAQRGHGRTVADTPRTTQKCHPEEHSDEGSARSRSQKLIWSRSRGARAPTPLPADASVLTLAKRSGSARATRATPNRLSAASASEQQIPRCARDDNPPTRSFRRSSRGPSPPSRNSTKNRNFEERISGCASFAGKIGRAHV